MMAWRLLLCGSSVYAQRNWSCSKAVADFAGDLSTSVASGCTVSVTTREGMMEGVAKGKDRKKTSDHSQLQLFKRRNSPLSMFILRASDVNSRWLDSPHKA